MVNGRVITGFSKPYVADYINTGGTVSYANAMPLARGVSVALSPTSAEDNNFYADNVMAESANGIFTGGDVTLTVDGLLTAAKRKVLGYPAAGSDGWTAVGAGNVPPYVGIGYIVRYMSDGVTSFQPYVLTKTRFNIPEDNANTQEDEIDWQTTELKAALMRDDSANHIWKFEGDVFSTEAAAEAALVTKLGGAAAPNTSLSALTIGTLALSPAFTPNVLTYTASTTNETDVITAIAANADATVTIVNGTSSVTNGSAATWANGENTVKITVADNQASTEYTVTVMKGE